MSKFYNHFYIIALLFVGLLSSCSSDDEPIIEELLEASSMLNVSYDVDDKQAYDIYLPAGRDENTKVLILVHGGSWVSGDKADVDFIKDIIVNELTTYAVVNLNYRLAGQGISPFPMQLDDITAAVNHLKANKEKYAISSDFGFIGVSAGAHLAMLWSYAYDTNNNVKMVGNIVGPTNLADPEYGGTVLSSTGLTFTTEFFLENSPLSRATATSPPTILFYGGKDPLIPGNQGPDLRDKLTELGVVNQFTLYPEEGHGWEGLSLLDTWNKMKAFIATHH